MSTDLSESQLRAIKKGASLGRTLQIEIPQIAQDYRNGLSKTQIIEKYGLMELYSLGFNVAQNAVRCHIGGHIGSLGIKSYNGSIPQDELEILASEHQAIGFNSMSNKQRRANGKRAHELGLGIHGFSDERRRKVGKAGGIKSRNDGLGFNGFTLKQKRSQQRKAMIASGKIPYTPREKIRISELAQNPDFQSGNKRPSYSKIAEQINIEFHTGDSIRTRCSINYALSRG